MSRFFRKKFLYNYQFTGRFKAIQNEKVNFDPLLTQITCDLRHFVSSGELHSLAARQANTKNPPYDHKAIIWRICCFMSTRQNSGVFMLR